jgi:copper(I)-binding protein
VSRSRRASTPLGRLAIAAAAVALVAGVTGCEAGNNAPTLQFHPQSAGIDAVAHGIQISDAFVLGAPIGSTLGPGQSAGFFLGLFNNSTMADKLTSVTAPGAATSVTVPAGGIELRSEQPVYLTSPVPKIVLTGLTQPLAGGGTVRITLNFQNTGSVTLTVPVLPRAYDYSTFSPAPGPTPTVTPSGTAVRHGKRSPGTSGSASPAPSGTAAATPTASATR